MRFNLHSPFQPTGDQPEAIKRLVDGFEHGKQKQVLLGVTGSGKTFSISNVIQKLQKPTLIISHNKTLAAQLYQEFRDFFPENAVSYFVSYYDYYQPEAYIPSTDTYIEKETQVNDDIDKLRLGATTNLLTRNDVIVVASVSCIYNLGSPLEYAKNTLEMISGELVSRDSIFMRLTDLQYQRSDADLKRASFRVMGETIQVWPAYQDNAIRLTMFGNMLVRIDEIDPLTGNVLSEKPMTRFTLYSAKHYIATQETRQSAISVMRNDLAQQVAYLQGKGKTLEAYRLEQRVSHDIDMIQEVGFVNGIENYSRYFDGRNAGDPPFTLLDHFAENAKTFGDGSYLTVIDESHITIPQIRGMYNGDQSRKQTLVNYGFRLPSALDNRPLRFEEFLHDVNDMVFVSATPNEWELSISNGQVIEQLIRPTGLIDPEIEIRKTAGQIQDLVREVMIRKKHGERVLITTLTKRMAEALSEYFGDKDHIEEAVGQHVEDLPKVQYLHSDIETLDRSDILQDLRRGVYDVLIGINLLREGLDLPEVSLVAILDADKEGFLRSSQSLIQTMGRAARHAQGKVIMYADKMTKSMQAAIDEVSRRRDIQLAYNKKHGITPQTIIKPLREQMVERTKDEEPKQYGKKGRFEQKKKSAPVLEEVDVASLTPEEITAYKKRMTKLMHQAAKAMNFELAATIRDRVRGL